MLTYEQLASANYTLRARMHITVVNSKFLRSVNEGSEPNGRFYEVKPQEGERYARIASKNYLITTVII